MALTYSLVCPQRRGKSAPSTSASPCSHPAPMPNTNRPPDTRSRVATSLASRMGLRSGTRQMPVPRRTDLVADAAAARNTSGSMIWLILPSAYTLGAPDAAPAAPTLKSAGTTPCSGAHSEPNPSSSILRASPTMSKSCCVISRQMPTLVMNPPKPAVIPAKAEIERGVTQFGSSPPP